MNKALEVIYSQADQEHINSNLGKNEPNELYRSWLDMIYFSTLFYFFLFFFFCYDSNFFHLTVLHSDDERRSETISFVR